MKRYVITSSQLLVGVSATVVYYFTSRRIIWRLRN